MQLSARLTALPGVSQASAVMASESNLALLREAGLLASSVILARRVLDSGLLPVINTGIVHRQAGIAQIGAGITHARLACFTQAVAALAATLPDK